MCKMEPSSVESRRSRTTSISVPLAIESCCLEIDLFVHVRVCKDFLSFLVLHFDFLKKPVLGKRNLLLPLPPPFQTHPPKHVKMYCFDIVMFNHCLVGLAHCIPELHDLAVPTTINYPRY